jgi:hypothetical protein
VFWYSGDSFYYNFAGTIRIGLSQSPLVLTPFGLSYPRAIPCVHHHITQRGNRRLPIFFSDEGRTAYLTILRFSLKPKLLSTNSGVRKSAGRGQGEGRGVEIHLMPSQFPGIRRVSLGVSLMDRRA